VGERGLGRVGRTRESVEQSAEPKTKGVRWSGRKGEIRLYMDLRGPNKKSGGVDFITPLNTDILKKMRGFDKASELDLTAAYHQILLTARSRKFTAFTNPLTAKKMRWKRMFFGDVGAAHTMQSIEMILKEAECDDFTTAYIDNIIVFTKGESIEGHAEKVGKVSRALTAVGLKLNPKKCQFGMKRARVLGHLISGETRTADPFKVAALCRLRRPMKGKQIKSLLGFTNFLRDYVPLYASIVGPLEKLRKNVKITNADWRGEPERAFETLKSVLSRAPILSQPDWSLPFAGSLTGRSGLLSRGTNARLEDIHGSVLIGRSLRSDGRNV